MVEVQSDRELLHHVPVISKTWLGKQCFELVLKRPSGFSFRAGQKIMVHLEGILREYTIASSPLEDIALCIKEVSGGSMSPLLAKFEVGKKINISGAYGYFIYRPGRAVFVATGTGVAPFAAYARSGVTGYQLLHGASSNEDFIYREVLELNASKYVSCLSSQEHVGRDSGDVYAGRVTRYLERELEDGIYDFYLCGNGEMIQDALQIIDNRFMGSRTYTERYYNG